LERQVDEWKMAPASGDPIYTDKPLLQRKLESLLEGQPKGQSGWSYSWRRPTSKHSQIFWLAISLYMSPD